MKLLLNSVSDLESKSKLVRCYYFERFVPNILVDLPGIKYRFAHPEINSRNTRYCNKVMR